VTWAKTSAGAAPFAQAGAAGAATRFTRFPREERVMQAHIQQNGKTMYHVRIKSKSHGQYSEMKFAAALNEFLESFNRAPKDVVLNFSEVGFMPTISLRLFDQLVRDVRGKGCGIAFLNLPENLHAIMAGGEPRSRQPRKFQTEKDAVTFVTRKLKKKESLTQQYLVCTHA
jgi:anti-anti-sigma regulatory factor